MLGGDCEVGVVRWLLEELRTGEQFLPLTLFSLLSSFNGTQLHYFLDGLYFAFFTCSLYLALNLTLQTLVQNPALSPYLSLAPGLKMCHKAPCLIILPVY